MQTNEFFMALHIIDAICIDFHWIIYKENDEFSRSFTTLKLNISKSFLEIKNVIYF